MLYSPGFGHRSVCSAVRPGDHDAPQAHAHPPVGGIGIHPYEIMLIINPDADEERQQEMLERAQELIREGGGVIEHLNDWGRRKITFPMEKQGDGRYVIITCSGRSDSLDELGRVLSINKEVVLRAMFTRLGPKEAEWAKAHGAPVPMDREPEGDSRPQRGRGRRRR